MDKINQTLNGKWTPREIPDLAGKVIIITGANSGIGYEAARELTRSGAEVIFASRDQKRAAGAIDKLRSEISDGKMAFIKLDLASLDSVGKFGSAFKSRYDRLDVLLNNAGIMLVPYSLTDDGFERTLGTNHLGHFALTGLLADLLMSTPGARVVNISSNAHYTGEMDFGNLLFEEGRDYAPMKAYSRSKLANLLFTYELQRRFEASGVSARSLAAHPGLSNTGLADHIFKRWSLKALRPLLGKLIQSAAMGALPGIRAAVDPGAAGGQYYGPDGKGERAGYPVEVGSNPASRNLDDARRLWSVSEELTGIRYLSQ